MLEAIVFRMRAGHDVAHVNGSMYVGELAAASDELERVRGYDLGAGLEPVVEEVGELLWEHVGIIRDGSGLREARIRLDGLRRRLDADALYGGYAISIARLMTDFAAARTSVPTSPEKNPDWQLPQIARERRPGAPVAVQR